MLTYNQRGEPHEASPQIKKEKKMEKYRFDDTYQQVHEYTPEQGGYLFVGSYTSFGLTPRMSDAAKTQAVDLALMEELDQ
jgi:hypothetical protein